MKRTGLLLLALMLPLEVLAARHAIVIGNSDYGGGLFKNLNAPVKDAGAMAGLIGKKAYGFSKPRLLLNKTKRAWEDEFEAFLKTLADGDTVVYYYSGHGVEVNGQNYLIPSGYRFKDLSDIRYDAIPAAKQLDKISERIGPRGLMIAILDACRDNPGKSSGGGLAEMNARGAYIAYAASPGEVAQDGVGEELSRFTRELIRQWATAPRAQVEQVIKQTGIEVANQTDDFQNPWRGGNLKGDFCLQTPCLVASLDPPTPDPQEASDSKAILPKLIKLPGGCFDMGQSEAEKAWLIEQSGQKDYDSYYNDERRHNVCVEPFEMAEHEVTVREFTRFVNETGYPTDAEKDEAKGCRILKDGKWSYAARHSWRNPNPQLENEMEHPVACVSQNDALAYVDFLNKNSPGGYRLPTEAEWEYAARGGSQDYYFWGSEIDNAACTYANVAGKGWSKAFPCEDGHQYVAPVKRFKPNDFELYDMLGNLWEWTCSKYDSKYQGAESRCVDNNEDAVVLRGGSWYSDPRNLRAAYRNWFAPDYRSGFTGFRVVRAAP